MGSGAAATPQGTKTTEPAGLPVRLAAMVYEGVLLFGVVFIVSYALLAALGWTYPLRPIQRLVLQSVLFLVVGAYFVYQWSRTGQTLAMKSWQLRLVANGGPPNLVTASVRYVLAWHLVLPGAVWTALYGGRVVFDLVAFLLGFVALLIPAAFDADRRLLHDRITSTRVVRER